MVTLKKTMVGKELHEEEVQSLREVVEEAVEAPPHKSKKNKRKRKDEVGPSKAMAQERTPSLVALSKGEIKTSVGSLIKTIVVPKKSKGKEKFLELKEDSLEHMDFHSFFRIEQW